MEDILYLENLLNIDYLNENIEYDPHDLFVADFYEYMDNEIVTEAVGVVKKNIFKKIGAIIKKIWKWICNKVQSLIDGFRKFTKGGKNIKKDISTIAIAALGGAAGFAVAKATSLKFSKQDNSKLTDDTLDNIANDAISGNSIGKYRLSVEYDNSDTIKFNILINGLKAALFPEGSKHGERHNEYIAVVFKCINKPSLLDGIIGLLQEIHDTHNINMSITDANKIVSNTIVKSTLGDTYVTSMAEWINFNEKTKKLGKLLEVWDNFNTEITQNNKPLTDEWVKLFNNIAQFSLYLSVGLNAISDSMAHSYDLDESLHNKIKDAETLSKFVNGCIESNIPGKYIHKGIKEITDVSINCKANDPNTKNNDYSKLTGQGRLILFTKNNEEILKIAYNEYGLRSNIIEKNVFDSLKDIPSVINQLCRIRKMSSNNVVMTIDRAKIEKVSTAKAAQVQNKINEELAKHKKPFKIVDINYKGFGYVNDKLVITDYGQIRRVTNIQDKENTNSKVAANNE